MADDTPTASAPAPEPSVTAGGLLRRAREAQGLHIAALAASLKIPQRKLEALERDRHDQLPDATFTRALAITVCRALKIDAAPVLALLPRAGDGALDQVAGGLNTPFRERDAGSEPGLAAVLRHPVILVVGLLLVAALALWLWPRPLVSELLPTPAEPAITVLPIDAAPPVEPQAEAQTPAEGQASAPAGASVDAASGAAPEPAVQAPAVDAAGPAAAPMAAEAQTPLAAPADAGAQALLALRTRDASWIEVVDGGGRALLSRIVQPGEAVALDGRLPLRLTIGNAQATELQFRGQAVDLLPLTRDNVARVELK